MANPDERDPVASARRAIRVWLAAGLLLLAFAPRVWKRGGRPSWFELAKTPLDRPSPAAAAQWTFLSDALRVLPNGATYTIFAPSMDDEMNLFMMSLGLYVERGHTPVPSSYLGMEYPGRGAGADYALDYGCGKTASAAYEPVARVRGGCVARSTLPRVERSKAAKP